MAFEDLRGVRSGGPVPGAPTPPTNALVPSTRPNWTYGDNAAPTARAPATGLTPSTRPDWVYGSNSPATDVPFKTVGGNPNVPPGGSAEARAFRTQQAANVGAPEPSGLRAGNPTPSMTGRMNNFAERVDTHGNRQVASMTEKAQGVANAVNRSAQNVRGFANAAGNAVRAVAEHPLGRVAGAGLAALDASRQIGGFNDAATAGDGAGMLDHGLRGTASALSMLPTPVGAVAGAFRVGQTVGDAVNAGLEKTEWGRGVGESIGRGVNNVARLFGGGVDDTALRRANGGSVPVRAAPTVTPTTAGGDAEREAKNAAVLKAAGQAQAEAQAASPGVVTRVGNSFSGDNIREGFSYGGDGAPANARPSSITTIPAANFISGSPGLRAELASKIEDAVARGVPVNPDGSLRASQSFGDGGITTGQGVGSFGTGRLGLPDAGGQSGQNLDNYTPAQLQYLAHQQSNATALRGQDIGAANAAAQIEQQRYNTDTQAGVQSQGHMLTARIQQMEKDRQFQLDLAKEGREAATANFNQREAADKNVLARLQALNPGSEPGKFNDGAVAEQKQYLDRGLADLGVEGFHKLGPAAQDQLLQASNLLARIKQDGGLLPWKPDLLKTVSPADLLGMQYDKQRDSYVITRGGSRALGQSIPARYFKREDAGYFFGAPTNRYDNLVRGVRDDRR